MKTVVFACVQNAGRSQMAAGFFNALVQPGRARARSAGTRPAPALHSEVIEAMREVDIDLADERPRLLSAELVAQADRVITMGCGEACPHVPGAAREDWPLPDPSGRTLSEVRSIRDAIRARVEALLAEQGWRA